MDYNFSERLKCLKPSAIREILKSLDVPGVISFAAGNPAEKAFPSAEIAKISAKIFEETPIKALQYNITEGYFPLRAEVEKRQKKLHGIGRNFDATIIVSGGQQGLELAARAFCDTDDVILCENPSFIGALNAFRSVGAKVTGVRVEDDGIDVAELEQKLRTTPRVKLIYLIPTFQNPTGVTTSLEKRKKILELAGKYGVVIIEDNPYGELRFAGEYIPPIKSFDDEGRVIYVSSFSKILSPGLRVGTVTAHADIIPKMVVAKQGEDVHTNIFSQLVCHRFMTECDIDGHIARLRALYGEKCALMSECLRKEIPESAAAFKIPQGGLFIWGTLKNFPDEARLIKEATARRIAIVPGSAFMCDPERNATGTASFRLNYSTPSEEDLIAGCARLGEAIRALE